MIDAETGTVWSHLDGMALSGAQAGTQLDVRPLQTTTWGAWVDQYPDTTVPHADTGYRYGRGNIGSPALGSTLLDTLDGVDDQLAVNELVIGVFAGTESRAFPLAELPPDAPIQDVVGEIPIVILEGSDGIPSLAYHRALTDGRVLDFERRDGAVFDAQTGSRWNASGLAVEGELAGVQLAFVTSFFTEWYGWAAFHPDTTIFSSGGA